MKFSTPLKLAISLVLLIGLISFVDFTSLVATFMMLSPVTVALLCLGYLAGQTLSAVKWWLIIRAGGMSASFWQVLRAYYVGMFVNVLGIGTVGGDMTRAILVSANDEIRTKGIASVVVDRAHGLAVLAAIGTLAALTSGSGILTPVQVISLATLGSGIVLGWITLLMLPIRIRNMFLDKFGKIGQQLIGAFDLVPRSPKLLCSITIISFTFHIVQIALHAYMAWSLSTSVPWEVLFVGVPFTNIASTLPFSWQGLGVRENAYQFFFVPQYLSTSQAVTFGAMWIFASTISGLVGGVVALVTNARGVLTAKVGGA